MSPLLSFLATGMGRPHSKLLRRLPEANALPPACSGSGLSSCLYGHLWNWGHGFDEPVISLVSGLELSPASWVGPGILEQPDSMASAGPDGQSQCHLDSAEVCGSHVPMTPSNVSPLCMSDLAPRVGMTSILMSAIGLPVCLSRAPQPASPPASCLASKSHSSVKRLRKMSMKGSSCSQILLASAKPPPAKSCCL